MPRVKRVAVVLAAGLGVASLTAGRPATSAAATARFVLAPAATVPHGAAKLGVLPSKAMVHASVVLASADPSALASAARAISTPGSTRFHHFMSASAARAAFGPTRAALSAVRAWLRRSGVHSGRPLGDGLVLPVSAPAQTLSNAFSTTLKRYRLSGGHSAIANATAVSVPAAVAGDVVGVIGLSTLTAPSSPHVLVRRNRREGRAPLRPAVATAASVPSACSQISSTSAGTVSQLTSFYDATPLFSAGDLGQGVTVGLLELQESYSADDIAAFDACYGASTSITPVAVDGGCSSCSAGTESTLDIETVIGMAPKAAIRVYQGPTLDDSELLNLIAKAVSDDKAQIISASLGECDPVEQDYDGTLASQENTQLELMAVQGQTMFAASGDWGSEACLFQTSLSGAYRTQLAVADPASQPYVTAVGGTSIGSLSNSTSETVWNAGPFTDYQSAAPNQVSTGGISSTWKMPSWQDGIVVNGLSSNVPCGAVSGSYCREVPDVAALADPNTYGYGIFYGCTSTAPSSCPVYSAGGTSFSSPLWASFLALIESGAPSNSGPLGFLNPTLYSIASAHPDAFHDVASGNNDYLKAPLASDLSGGSANDSCTYAGSSSQPCYEATSGYDLATGLGTPDVSLLEGYLQTAFPSVSTSSLPAASEGVSYTASLSATGGTPPYSWSVAAGSLPLGLNLSTSGSISGTPTASGSFSVHVQVNDSDGALGTAALGLSVAPTLLVASSVLPSGDVGVSYDTTLSASGGSGGNRWSLPAGDTAPAGLSVGSDGTVSGVPQSAGTFTFAVEVTDSYGASASASVQLGVESPPTITTSVLPSADVGSNYSSVLAASGGTAPLSWSVTSGSLPAGLSLSSGGSLGGVASQSGTSAFTVMVHDALGASASASYQLVVAPQLGLATSTLPAAVVGSSYQATLNASGGQGSNQWSLAGGSAPPPGLSIEGDRLVGTPSAPGQYAIAVTVTDAIGVTATETFSLVVARPPLERARPAVKTLKPINKLLVVPVRCARPCRGIAVVHITERVRLRRQHKLRSEAKVIQLARGGFGVGRSHRGLARLRLTPAGLALVRRSGSRPVIVQLTLSMAGMRSRTFRVALGD